MLSELYASHLDLSVGDTIFYAAGEDNRFTVKKTRVTAIEERSYSLVCCPFPFEYKVYLTDDGTVICQTEIRHQQDEIEASRVYLTKQDVVKYIIRHLGFEVRRQRQAVLDARARLAETQRLLATWKSQATKAPTPKK